MQFDRAPASSPLASLHIANATDRTLELALQPDGASRVVDLQRAMRALCDEARRQGMRAEDLIVLFKKTWQARPEPHHMSREETGQLFDSLVTMCIEEFYDGAR